MELQKQKQEEQKERKKRRAERAAKAAKALSAPPTRGTRKSSRISQGSTTHDQQQAINAISNKRRSTRPSTLKQSQIRDTRDAYERVGGKAKPIQIEIETDEIEIDEIEIDYLSPDSSTKDASSPPKRRKKDKKQLVDDKLKADETQVPAIAVDGKGNGLCYYYFDLNFLWGLPYAWKQYIEFERLRHFSMSLSPPTIYDTSSKDSEWIFDLDTVNGLREIFSDYMLNIKPDEYKHYPNFAKFHRKIPRPDGDDTWSEQYWGDSLAGSPCFLDMLGPKFSLFVNGLYTKRMYTGLQLMKMNTVGAYYTIQDGVNCEFTTTLSTAIATSADRKKYLIGCLFVNGNHFLLHCFEEQPCKLRIPAQQTTIRYCVDQTHAWVFLLWLLPLVYVFSLINERALEERNTAAANKTNKQTQQMEILYQYIIRLQASSSVTQITSSTEVTFKFGDKEVKTFHEVLGGIKKKK